MIAVIVDGGNTGGLIRYLVGPGRANEHTDPHVVAGSGVIMDRWGDWSELSGAQAGEIAMFVDQFMLETGKESFGEIRGVNPVTGETGVRRVGQNHTWHCSLSLSPEEGALSEEKWAGIATDFMNEMGFTETSGKSPCRWVAINHGEATNGGHHIHIAANIIREDGTKWNRWQDQRKSQRTVNQLEHKYGLMVIEAREHARGAISDTAAQLHTATIEETSNVIPTANTSEKRPASVGVDVVDQKISDRAWLETRVRAAATAASSEVDFISRTRRLGIQIRPRFASGRTDVVLGYSVSLPTMSSDRPQWYGGGSLARDLTLPRLRQRWPSTVEGATDAVQAWQDSENGLPLRPTKHEIPESDWQTISEALSAFNETLSTVDPLDPVALADATSDVSGLLAAASAQEGISRQTSGLLAKASRSVGQHSQLHHRPPMRNTTADAITLGAGLLLTASMPPNSPYNQVAIVADTLRLVQSLVDLYRAANQANTANRMLRDTKAIYSLIHREGEHVQMASTAYAEFEQQAGRIQTDILPEPQQVEIPKPERETVKAGAERTRRLLATMPDAKTMLTKNKPPASPSPVRPPRPAEQRQQPKQNL